ncbi:MAG: glucose-1-phosphate thymidylyltransferase, partial [bacterium]
EITDAIQYLIDKDFVVNSHIVEGWWKDTGKLSDILEANQMILAEITTELESEPGRGSEVHGSVRTGKKVKIEGSVLRGPCVIGSGASIIDSYIGPFTSIGPNTRVVGSEVENSIILEDCAIENIGSRIGNSLVGRNVTIARNDRPPRSYEFMVGDNSNIIIF